MEFTHHTVLKKFKELFSGEPTLVRSPGRINLIGEHTDYNHGFVMPASVDHATVFAFAAAEDKKSTIYSIMYDEFFQIDLANTQRVESPAWVNYLLGVIKQYQMHGYAVRPFNCVFGGNIPLGAGLSSSASIACGFAYGLSELNRHHIDKLKLIHMAQWSEHNYAGVKCGIMDQFASMMGQEGKVILLDCRSLEYRYFPFALTDHALILCNTNVKHALVDSEYNTRRSECEEGVAILQQSHPAIRSLRDVSEEDILMHRSEMKNEVFYRCLYVVQEIKRVEEASEDLQHGRLDQFGKKMFDTHDGLSKLYQVSCEELDFLVEHARKFSGVIGARMMGGGFGGCTINIVSQNAVDGFITSASEAYHKKFAIKLETYKIKIKDGTNIIKSSDEILL